MRTSPWKVEKEKAISGSAYVGHEIVKTRGQLECDQETIHAHNCRTLL
jgi:hypothetical protein